MKGTRIAALTLFALAPVSTAHADTQQCIDAFSKGQPLRKDGKLIEARAEFVTCASESCPAFFQKTCAEWLQDLDKHIPSIVLGAKDATRRDLTEVRVSLDGAPLATHLDGRAIDLDPGSHTFVFEAAAHARNEVTVLLRDGEKGRDVSVELAQPAVVAPAHAVIEKRRPITLWTWIAAGVGVVGAVGWATLGTLGAVEWQGLQSCRGAGACNPSDVDQARLHLALADVFAGVTVVGFGVATVGLLTRPTISVAVRPEHAGLAVVVRY